MSILGQTVANHQTRSGHQGGVDTGNVNPLHIDEYGGEVEHRFLKESFMRQFFNFKSVRGTDTVTNDRMGHTQLQKVSRGVRPVDHSPTFDNISVKVDTIVLARTNTFLLEEFQEHFDTRMEIGLEHGKEIGKFFDEAFLVQGIKASQITNRTPVKNAAGDITGTADNGGFYDAIYTDRSGLGDAAAVVTATQTLAETRTRTAPEGFQGATAVILNSADDEIDAVALELAIQDVCQGVEEKDVDIESAVILLRPAQYYTLLRNSLLLDKDFSTANGDYAKGQVLMSNGVRIQKTNRFPKASDVGQTHYLSNAGNGNAYDVTQVDVNAVAVLLMPKALLAGETIPLTSKVYYVDQEFQWFIDSYLSFGVTPNRAEMAAAIYTKATGV
jgi:hypothetical protein